MLKQAVCILLLASISLSGVSFEEARDTVLEYQYSGESIAMNPQRIVNFQSRQFWVFEFVSFNKIQVMVPIDSETGRVYREPDTPEILKIHYLANFFETNDAIEVHLDSTLVYAQQMQSDLDSKLTNLESNVEPFLDVEINAIEPYKKSVREAIEASDSLRSQINLVKGKIKSVNSETDVITLKSDMEIFFSRQANFLRKLEAVVSESSRVHTEANQKVSDGTLEASVRDSLLVYTNYPGLSSQLIQKKDNLQTNERTVMNFFYSLDDQAKTYKINLDKRVTKGAEELEKKEVLEKLGEYSKRYEAIQGAIIKGEITDSAILSQTDELYDLLQRSFELCGTANTQDCLASKRNYDNLEYLASSLETSVRDYMPGSCVSGTVENCLTQEGRVGERECIGGQWTDCSIRKKEGGLNFTLIIGVIIVIAAAVGLFKFKDKIIPEKSEIKTEGQFSNWQSQQYKF